MVSSGPVKTIAVLFLKRFCTQLGKNKHEEDQGGTGFTRSRAESHHHPAPNCSRSGVAEQQGCLETNRKKGAEKQIKRLREEKMVPTQYHRHNTSTDDEARRTTLHCPL